MVNKFKLSLEGQPYDVERRGDLIVVNGSLEFPFSVKGNTVTVNGTPHTVDIAGKEAKYDGIGYPIEAVGLEEPKPKGVKKASKASADAAGAVTAIMPGLIIKVLVKENDRVQAGDTVCILEAMKMQNELHAKQNGVVKSVLVKEGDTVEMRQVLVVVEE